MGLRKRHFDEGEPLCSRYQLRRRCNPEWRLRRLGDLVQRAEIVALARKAGVERISAASVEEIRRALIDFLKFNIEAIAAIKRVEEITERDIDASLSTFKEKRLKRS